MTDVAHTFLRLTRQLAAVDQVLGRLQLEVETLTVAVQELKRSGVTVEGQAANLMSWNTRIRRRIERAVRTHARIEQAIEIELGRVEQLVAAPHTVPN